jgi:hypothetical protein
MATMAQLAMTRLDEARCEALFVSSLQPSDAPTAAGQERHTARWW